jgi:glycosyltransferase involved in cell wall biosynthesis
MGSLVQQADQLCITNEVRFLGAFDRKNLHTILTGTDIFILPSLSEGLGLAIVEAMAYSKPVVATSVGGIPEVVEHQKTGLLVPPGQPDRLAAALLTLIEDEPLRLRMGAAGRKKFESGSYTVESYMSATLAIYKEAMELTAVEC